MLTTPDRAEPICRALIHTFDEEVPQLYSPEDRQRGYISGADRYGILRRFDLMSISIGVVTTERRGFSDQESLTRVAAEMKHHAKEQPGSTYAVDQRTSLQGSEVERRRAFNRTLLLLSGDSSLRAVLRTTFRDAGYNVIELERLDGAYHTIDTLKRPALVLADAQLGEMLWDLCATHSGDHINLPFVVLAHDEQDIARAQAIQATTHLQLPLPLIDIVACVEQLITGNAASEEKMRGAT
jgi:CheY-like chemotaxis protein